MSMQFPIFSKSCFSLKSYQDRKDTDHPLSFPYIPPNSNHHCSDVFTHKLVLPPLHLHKPTHKCNFIYGHFISLYGHTAVRLCIPLLDTWTVSHLEQVWKNLLCTLLYNSLDN